jgi:hypothetical protein
VDLRAADRRPARLARAGRVLDGAVGPGRPERLGELAGGAARGVGLAGAGVVDHLPVRQVPGRELRGGLGHRRGEREVARGDDADAAAGRRRLDLREVVGGQARRADHDRHAALDRRQRVGLDDGVRRVVDHHVDAVERLGDARVHGRARDLAAGRRAAHARAQLEVLGGRDGLDERAAGPAGRPGDAQAQGLHDRE